MVVSQKAKMQAVSVTVKAIARQHHVVAQDMHSGKNGSKETRQRQQAWGQRVAARMFGKVSHTAWNNAWPVQSHKNTM